ncbi:MAG: class I SAM-dependent methyltransferase, partial [Chloroflexota bacterium]
PVWAAGDRYESYVGRWSRLVAARFLSWIGFADRRKWVDVGCGTGALLQTILAARDPTLVAGVDRSENFLRHAGQGPRGEQALLAVSDGQSLPFASAVFDAAVSGLVLNFVPHPEKMVSEMSRVTQAGGTCAVYVWDYAGKMELMRYFWDSASDLDREAGKLDEGPLFPICQPGPLKELFVGCGLVDVEVQALDVPTVFKNFDDYWSPFLGGQGPAPAYAMSLRAEKRIALRETLRKRLPIEEDGSIRLVARAWAVKGRRA